MKSNCLIYISFSNYQFLAGLVSSIPFFTPLYLMPDYFEINILLYHFLVKNSGCISKKTVLSLQIYLPYLKNYH